MSLTCMHLLAFASYSQVNCIPLRIVTGLFGLYKDKSELCKGVSLLHYFAAGTGCDVAGMVTVTLRLLINILKMFSVLVAKD